MSLATAQHTNYALLNIAEERLEFWQGQLQAAFRDGNDKRAVECERMISEYALSQAKR